MASFFLFFFFFSQTLRVRNKANKQTEGERAQQTTEAKDEDERDPYSLCSSVDLDKVCACFETGLICDQMKSASFLHLFFESMCAFAEIMQQSIRHWKQKVEDDLTSVFAYP